jgi:hypothetical protein
MTTAKWPEGSLSEVTCQRSVQGPNFASGNQTFVWSVGSPNIFVPSESYFVLDVTVTAEGRQPLLSDEIALSTDPGACLYNNAYAKVGGQDVSSVTNFLSQASIVNNRLKKTKTWTETVGKSVHGLEPSFLERQKSIAYDGKFTYDQASLVNVSNNPAATIAITALGVITGVNTTFLANDFDQIIYNGIHLKVTSISSDTAATVEVTAQLTANGNIAAATIDKYQLYLGGSAYSLGNNRQFIVWQPPIGFFDYSEPMGAGDYMIQLNPNADFKKSVVSSTSDKTVGNGAGQFDFVVNDVKLYIATYKHTIPDTPVIMGLRESLVQSKTLTGGTEQFQFTVPPSTVGISFFVQANAAGSNTEYSPTYLGTDDAEQNLISSYQITYANKTLPQTRWSGVLDVIGATPNQISRDTLQQRYYDTFTEAGLIEYGPETLNDWVTGGQLVYNNFVRSSEYRATQVQFSITSTAAYTVPTKLYLVAHYKTSTEIQTSMGMITSVRSLSVM